MVSTIISYIMSTFDLTPSARIACKILMFYMAAAEMQSLTLADAALYMSINRHSKMGAYHFC